MKYLNKKYGNNVYPTNTLFPHNNLYPASQVGLVPKVGLKPRRWLKPNISKHSIIAARLNGKEIIGMKLGSHTIY